ncbi:hypothetical protein PsYK624_137960 [Phanerochaete sordida]|uniref:Uncharacterized protein n=1 Tax=Phanerochaete sordida TaxID=48140 RepID=A0A9P3GQA1_9APHY|nr:hypothetical protein PsYK624_137960 [Phanerochaete sordida]
MHEGHQQPAMTTRPAPSRLPNYERACSTCGEQYRSGREGLAASLFRTVDGTVAAHLPSRRPCACASTFARMSGVSAWRADI